MCGSRVSFDLISRSIGSGSGPCAPSILHAFRAEPFPATPGLLSSVAPMEYSDLKVCRNFERRSYFLLGALLRTSECSWQCSSDLDPALR